MDPKDVLRRTPHPIVAAVLLILGLIIMLGSLKYGFGSAATPGAGFLPFFSGIFIAFFASIQLLQSWQRKWDTLRSLWEGTKWTRTVIVTLGLVLYSVFLKDVGFLLATMILMVCFFRLLDRPSWMVTLFAALMTTLGFHLVFQIWLKCQLPTGFLGF